MADLQTILTQDIEKLFFQINSQKTTDVQDIISLYKKSLLSAIAQLKDKKLPLSAEDNSLVMVVFNTLSAFISVIDRPDSIMSFKDKQHVLRTLQEFKQLLEVKSSTHSDQDLATNYKWLFENLKKLKTQDPYKILDMYEKAISEAMAKYLSLETNDSLLPERISALNIIISSIRALESASSQPNNIKFQKDINHLVNVFCIPINQRIEELNFLQKIYIEKLKQEYYANPKQLTQQPWLDIPKTLELSDVSPKTMELIQLISLYHDIPKTERRLLPQRISALQTIQQQAERLLLSLEHVPTEEERTILLKLSQQSYSKILYLQQLDHIEPQKPIDTFKTIFGGINEKGMSITRNKMDGTLAIEIDPALRTEHALFKTLWEQWQLEAQSHYDAKQPFFSFLMWLEGQDEETKKIFLQSNLDNILLHNNVDHEKNHYRLKNINTTQIRDGLIKDTQGNIVSGQYIYAIDVDGVLHIGKDTQPNNHPYIACDGKGVLCAGHITLENGKIKNIDNNSGHYRPKSFQLQQVVKMLAEMNVFSKTAQVSMNSGTSLTINDNNWCPLKDTFEKINATAIYSIREPGTKTAVDDTYANPTRQTGIFSTKTAAEIVSSLDKPKLEAVHKNVAAKKIQSAWRKYRAPKKQLPHESSDSFLVKPKSPPPT